MAEPPLRRVQLVCARLPLVQGKTRVVVEANGGGSAGNVGCLRLKTRPMSYCRGQAELIRTSYGRGLGPKLPGAGPTLSINGLQP